MKPATRPRSRHEHSLAVVDGASGRVEHGAFDRLAEVLEPGDLLVVNDAATIPAAIGFEHGGKRAELRLLFRGEGVADAIVLGEGDSRRRTEDRGAAPKLLAGERVTLDGDLSVRVIAVEDARHVVVELEDVRGLYRAGKAVQYAYMQPVLELWDVQTAYAGRPWASEMPSAGRPLSWRLLGLLRGRGVEIARITHGAGLSSTGDPELDRRLPLPERYRIDERAARAVNEAKGRGRRVIAVGTSVVRALETAARRSTSAQIVAAEATTNLFVDAGTEPLVVDALLTGMHEAGSSHFSLLEAFAGRALLEEVNAQGDARGLLLHEFGDSMLLFGKRRGSVAHAA